MCDRPCAGRRGLLSLNAEAVAFEGSGCRNNMPGAGQLKQQTLIFSQFWELEVQDQRVNGVAPW